MKKPSANERRLASWRGSCPVADQPRTYVLHGGPADGRAVTAHEGRFVQVPVGKGCNWCYDLQDPKDATPWIEYFTEPVPRG